MRKSGKSVNVGGKPFSKVLGVGLPLLLVSLLGLWGGTSRSAAVAPSETSRSPQAAPGVAGLSTQPQGVSPRPMAGTRAWIPGALYRYALNAEQKISFRPAQPGAQALPGMRFILRGEWTVGIVSAEAERVDARVSLRLSSLTVEVGDNGPVAPDVQQNLATALQLPFFLTHDKSGRVTLTHFEQAADPLVRGILRSVVASSQFVVDGAPGATWTAEEFDTTGRYSAGYQRLAPDRFEKRKLSYSHVAFPQGLEPLGGQVRIDVSARSTFTLAQDLWTSSLDAQERVAVEAGQTMSPTTYESSLSLSLLERRVDPTLIGAFVARRAWLSSAAMSAFQGMEQDPMDQYRQVLGGNDFDTLVKELRALPDEPTARDEVRSIALERLRALFMLQPSEAAKVPAIIRAGMAPLAASPMLGALSAASTREAIQALAEVTGDRAIPHDIRMDSVAALGVAKEPTAEGLAALRGVAGEEDGMLRDTARLALGNAAAQLTDTDPKGAEDLVGELTRDYRSASTAEAQVGALNSLGNTRAPSALATLEDALRSQDPQVRQAALNALRIIQDPRADQLLAKHLLEDPAPEVRQAAVFASNFRLLAPLLPALAQALRMDPADRVRNEVIHLLGDQRALVPEALPLLAWASQHDANPDLRQAAAVFVNTPTTSSSTP